MIEERENLYKPRPVVKKIIRNRTFNEAGINQINLIHFPQRPLALYSDVEFLIQKNHGKGDIEVKLLCPSGRFIEIPTYIIDFDRLAVRFAVDEIGDHYVHVKYNSKTIPNSPYPLIVHPPYSQSEVILQDEEASDAAQVKLLGMALKRIELGQWNEFRVDASAAGFNFLMVGITGPLETNVDHIVRHLGNGLYVVSYHPITPGPYVISVKWGEEDVTGSPYLIFAT